MDFNDIYGHDKIIKNLKNAFVNNTISHGYLFTGMKGLGKKKVAMSFAKTLLCEKEMENACNTCSSCLKFNTDNHPDLYIEKPDGGSFKKEQIESIQKEMKTLPYESKRKIFILHDIDKMTIQAQNSFLKTLEEPPRHTVIIMTSVNSYSILPTIISRSQILRFSPIKTKEIEKAILEHFNKSDDEAEFIAGFCNGIVGKAINICESEEFNVLREELVDLIDYILSSDKFQIFSKVEYFEKNKNNIYDIMDMIYIWFRDLLLIKESNNHKLIINKDKIELLLNQSKKISRQKIYEVLEVIKDTKDNIISKVNFQLSIEIMLLKIQEV